jgi:hypothetical protein
LALQYGDGEDHIVIANFPAGSEGVFGIDTPAESTDGVKLCLVDVVGVVHTTNHLGGLF